MIASKSGAVMLEGVWVVAVSQPPAAPGEGDVTAEFSGAGIFLGISKSSLHFPFVPHPESWKSI